MPPPKGYVEDTTSNSRPPEGYAEDDPKAPSNVPRLLSPEWLARAKTISAHPTKFERQNSGLGRQFTHRMASYLPTVGGTIGGIVGTGGGLPTGPGAALTGAGGAALGGAAGKSVENNLNRLLGFDAPKSAMDELKSEGTEALIQGGSELVGGMLTKAVAPSLIKTINKLYYAGKLGEKEELEVIMPEVLAMEKANPATTLEEFTEVLKKAKNKIGQEVDSEMLNPIVQNGRQVPLAHADADVTPIKAHIESLITKHPSDVKMNPAKINAIRARASKYLQPDTFGNLTDRRIVLNYELNNYNKLSDLEKSQYLVTHPEFEIDKAEADAIRDVVYPQMDKAAGKPAGFTEQLQKRRGALLSTEKQATQNFEKLRKESKWSKGSPPGDRLHAYGSSHGNIGVSTKLLSLIRTPDKLSQANKQVSRAFTHTPGSKVGKLIGTKTGQEGIALPLRTIDRTNTEHEEDEE